MFTCVSCMYEERSLDCSSWLPAHYRFETQIFGSQDGSELRIFTCCSPRPPVSLAHVWVRALFSFLDVSSHLENKRLRCAPVHDHDREILPLLSLSTRRLRERIVWLYCCIVISVSIYLIRKRNTCYMLVWPLVGLLLLRTYYLLILCYFF